MSLLPRSLLVVAAHELELRPLCARLAREGDLAQRVRTAVVGVGMAAAGAGTAQVLAREATSRVLLLGSCGAYPGRGLPLLALHAPGAAIATDGAVLSGKAALPEAMPQRVEVDRQLHASLCAVQTGLIGGPVATTLGITMDDALARAIAQRSPCVSENLEALAVGLACARSGRAFAMLLGCTNEVGASGRAQWRKHHARAAELTADVVLAWAAAKG